MDRVLYFIVGRNTFVLKDMIILEKDFELIEFFMPTKKVWKIPFSLIQQFYFLLKYRKTAKLIIVQFAGYHSLIPAFLGNKWQIPTLLVAGGTESVSYPSINYGNYRKKLYGWFTKKSIALFSHVAPVHESLVKWKNHYYPVDGIDQGMEVFAAPIAHKTTIVANAYDSTIFKYSDQKKKNTFLTVGIIDSRMRYLLKGCDLIMDIAPHFPNCHFTFLGLSYHPPKALPPNVSLLPPVSPEKLPEVYADQEFYFQLSISEGHPNALCEAMLSGCIPIASAVNAIPEIVSDTGYLLAKRDEKMLIALVEKALKREKEDLGRRASKRIQELFPFERRTNELLQVAHKLIEDAKSD